MTTFFRTSGKGRRATRTAASAVIGVLSLASVASATECGDLAGKTYGGASVVSASSVAPPSSLMGIDPPAPVAIEARFCRVEGVGQNLGAVGLKFEVWLPEKSTWNGKYEGVGNGGFAGSLIYVADGLGLAAGYAVSATDTGH